MARAWFKSGDLVTVSPRKIVGVGEDLVLIRSGTPPTEVTRVTGDPSIICIFLRYERIDMSLDRAMMPVVLYDGCEYTVLIGKLRLCE